MRHGDGLWVISRTSRSPPSVINCRSARHYGRRARVDLVEHADRADGRNTAKISAIAVCACSRRKQRHGLRFPRGRRSSPRPGVVDSSAAVRRCAPEQCKTVSGNGRSPRQGATAARALALGSGAWRSFLIASMTSSRSATIPPPSKLLSPHRPSDSPRRAARARSSPLEPPLESSIFGQRRMAASRYGGSPDGRAR